MERVLSDKKAICLFVIPAFLVFALVVLIPIFVSGYYSLLKWDGIGKSIYIGFENYKNLFTNDPYFIKSIGNSFILALLSIFVQLPLSMLFALILARGVKGESFYRTIYFIPVIVSTVVIGQLWMKIYNPSYGLLNTFLRAIGLESMTGEWLGSMDTALGSAFVPIVWQYIGYHMLLMYTAAKSVSEEIYEAATIDGASGLQMAFRITIPLIKPMIKVCVTFALIGSLKTFDLIYVLTNGGPVHSSEVPSIIMFNTIFHKYEYGYGSAMSVFIIAECLLLTVVIQKMFNIKKNVSGGLKK